jgi:hypothetical protein
MTNLKITKSNRFEIKTFLGEDRTTNAEVKAVDLFGDTLVIGRGKARWNPIDAFDPEIGEGVATGRALAKFGKNLARFWEKQSSSIGEVKAARKRQQLIQELGEVNYLMLMRKPAKEVSPERLAWIEEQKKKAKNKTSLLDRIENAVNIINTDITNTDNLDAVVETNRAKLETPANKGGQHI